ncbi:MAG TPA: tRNA (adenosine(37)-N6)-threonylcarbamoyltransferase complex ATPase subunit type 1 TsaE [Phycisphaerales bacterium]|nr:tRNA (adenosine(37)-N6)-threonylcarbamoyltransferase complex ATPase subunit type 1 TsaE [Phycisphaerales bacterium]
MELTCVSRSEEQTVALGSVLAGVLRAGDVVTLDGELGAGKTRIVRGLCRALGVDAATVASPTYVIVHQYPADNTQGIRMLSHVDAYRLGGEDELESVGWEHVIDRTAGRAALGTAAVIEWSRRIGGAVESLDAAHLARVEMGGVEDHADRRRVTLRLPDAWIARPALTNAPGWPSPGEALVDAFVRLGAPLPHGWTRCPVSHRAVSPANPHFPFADDRSRRADLGKWLSGSYTVSRELREDDLGDPDLAPGPGSGG